MGMRSEGYGYYNYYVEFKQEQAKRERAEENEQKLRDELAWAQANLSPERLSTYIKGLVA